MEPKIQTGIRLPPRLLAWYKAEAEAAGYGLSEYLRRVLEKHQAEIESYRRTRKGA